ncbi:MAG: Isoprenylcysteine carboxyl methyltransferase [Pseudomonadota bacterium]|jgi:methyltransferase
MSALFWVLYGYCVLERLGELVISRRNQAQMKANGFSEKETSAGVRFMIALHSLWYVAMLVEVVSFPSTMPALVRYGAATAFLAAQVLRFWALSTLGGFWNISVVTADRSGPRFVSHGPYRFIRHPNYVVVIIEIATLPLVGGAVWTSAIFTVLNGIVLARRIPLEESHLFRVSGYRDVMGGKGRFIPRHLFGRR